MDYIALEKSVLIQEGLLVLNQCQKTIISPLKYSLTMISSWIDNFILGEKTVIQLRRQTFPTQKIKHSLGVGE